MPSDHLDTGFVLVPPKGKAKFTVTARSMFRLKRIECLQGDVRRLKITSISVNGNRNELITQDGIPFIVFQNAPARLLFSTCFADQTIEVTLEETTNQGQVVELRLHGDTP